MAQNLLCFSIGYIAFDLIIILKEIQDFSTLGIQNLAHHLIALIATVSSILAGGCFPLASAATTFTELSTILLHIRYYMIKLKKADGYAFLVVMVSFISMFGYSRMYVQMRLAYAMFVSFNTGYTDTVIARHFSVLYFQYSCLAMMTLLQCLNIFWFWKMLLGVHKVLTKGMGEATFGSREHGEANGVGEKKKSKFNKQE